MMMNLLKFIFAFKIITTIFGGVLINFFDKFMPSHFKRFYRHGRYNESIKSRTVEKLEVPKRWFKHFYTFSAPYSLAALAIFCYRYFLNGKVPDVIIEALQFFMDAPLKSLIPPEHALLAMCIFSIHCCKRFYESHYVSVFSDVTMNFFLYLIGLSHYFGGIMSIVGDAQDIGTDKKITLDWSRLTWLEYTCTAVFFVSTYLQYRSNLILSSLRRDKRGVVVTKQHKIPTGGLFEYVTAPLQFTEIVLYICLSVIMRDASTFHFVTAWTIANQVECAYLAHEWALKKFENYPKSRKMLIPFIL